MLYIEGHRSKRTWETGCGKDCQACKLNKDDAIDHSNGIPATLETAAKT